MELDQYRLLESAEDRMWWLRALRRNLSHTIGQYDHSGPGAILDAGCATGGYLRKLGARYMDHMIIGLDIETHALIRARGNSGQLVVCGSINLMPFASDCFAVIVSADLLYHRAVDPENAVREIARTLAPGGIFVVTVPAYEWMWSAHDERQHAARRYTRRRLKAELDGAGLDVEYTTYWNMFLFPLMALRRKILTPRDHESDLITFPAAIDALFGVVMNVEHLLLRLGVRLPFGGSLLAVGRKKSSAAAPDRMAK